MSWLCKCGAVTSHAFDYCCYQSYKPNVEHGLVGRITPDFTGVAIATGYARIERSCMTKQEELYVQFYNKSRNFIVDMDMTQLREHREMLSAIAYEAKVTLGAVDDELRERTAKSNKKDWLITPTNQNQTTSDAINAVKIRKERMSKVDRMYQQFLSAGIDEQTAKEMAGKVEKNMTSKNEKAITNTKAVSFGQPKSEEKKPNGEDEKAIGKTLDLSKFFGKKSDS